MMRGWDADDDDYYYYYYHPDDSDVSDSDYDCLAPWSLLVRGAQLQVRGRTADAMASLAENLAHAKERRFFRWPGSRARRL